MNKTAEWWLRGYEPRADIGTFAWIQAIIDDARAGMVPEGECIQPVYMFDEDGKEHEAPCECCERRGKPSGQHEAELAKAWEAGASAALAECPHGQPNCSTCRDRIRALQPPGGKAK